MFLPASILFAVGVARFAPGDKRRILRSAVGTMVSCQPTVGVTHSLDVPCKAHRLGTKIGRREGRDSNSLLLESADGDFLAAPLTPAELTKDGLVVSIIFHRGVLGRWSSIAWCAPARIRKSRGSIPARRRGTPPVGTHHPPLSTHQEANFPTKNPHSHQ